MGKNQTPALSGNPGSVTGNTRNGDKPRPNLRRTLGNRSGSRRREFIGARRRSRVIWRSVVIMMKPLLGAAPEFAAAEIAKARVQGAITIFLVERR